VADLENRKEAKLALSADELRIVAQEYWNSSEILKEEMNKWVVVAVAAAAAMAKPVAMHSNTSSSGHSTGDGGGTNKTVKMVDPRVAKRMTTALSATSPHATYVAREAAVG
jgi:hypothetical protein